MHIVPLSTCATFRMIRIVAQTDTEMACMFLAGCPETRKRHYIEAEKHYKVRRAYRVTMLEMLFHNASQLVTVPSTHL